MVSSAPEDGAFPPSAMEHASYPEVLSNGPFRHLWSAQIISQLAQNLTWITLTAFVAEETKKATLISITTISGLLAPLLLSAIAGVVVDRTSKRVVLLTSNVVRVGITLLFIAATGIHDRNHTVQTATIVALIFVASAVAQFFAPAEAAAIPLLIEKKNLIVASSLFNITFNICQVLPITLGVALFNVTGIVPILLAVAVLYVIAAFLVSTLPAVTSRVPTGSPAMGLREGLGHIVGDTREALYFLARHPELRLLLFQINVAPTFVFVFLPLGLTFVPQTFGLEPKQASILLVPAGVGLMLGAAATSRAATVFSKERLIDLGLLVMGGAVAVLGGLAALARLVGPTLSHGRGLIPAAIVLSLIIGIAMSMSSIPAQTLVFESTTEAVRGRILSMQLLVGAALPLLPLLTVGLLADLVGTGNVMVGLGIIIIGIGVFSMRIQRSPSRLEAVHGRGEDG